MAVDFSPAREEGLMPNDDDYADWLKAFIDKED